MTTIINNPGSEESSTGVAVFFVGLIALIIFVALFFVFLLPMIRNSDAAKPSNAIDVTVKLPTTNSAPQAAPQQ